jgi:hypothetical protein
MDFRERGDRMSELRTIWSHCGDDAPASQLAAEVKIYGDSNSVDLFVTHGPAVMLSIEPDGSFTVAIFRKGHAVKIESDLPEADGDLVECVLSAK